MPQEFIFRGFIATAAGTVQFASALSRSVTGSMNDLVNAAQIWLTEAELSPFDVGFKINNMPMSFLDYKVPRDAFKALGVNHPNEGH